MKRLRHLVAFAAPPWAALGAVLSLAGCDRLEARDLVRAGNAAYEAGRYEEAIEAYTASLALDPSLTTALWNRACAAEGAVLELGRPEAKGHRAELADLALRDFEAWLAGLEAPSAEDAEAVAQHRLAILDADGRCDALIAHWRAEHEAEPEEEQWYGVIARQYEKCGDLEARDAWYEQRTRDFQRSVKAWHQLALRTYEPLWPPEGSDQEFDPGVPPAERIRIADRVIALLDRATAIDPEFRDAYVWRAKAYAQRQWARVLVDDPQRPEERFEAVRARQDAALAWQERQVVCRLDALPACTPDGSAAECCPPPPMPIAEQVADAAASLTLAAELAAQRAAAPEAP